MAQWEAPTLVWAGDGEELKHPVIVEDRVGQVQESWGWNLQDVLTRGGERLPGFELVELPERKTTNSD